MFPPPPPPETITEATTSTPINQLKPQPMLARGSMEDDYKSNNSSDSACEASPPMEPDIDLSGTLCVRVFSHDK